MTILAELIEIHLGRIATLIEEQKFNEAENVAETLLTIDPNSTQIMQLYGIILCIQGKHEDSLKTLLKLINVEKSIVNYINLSQAYLGVRDFENAILALRNALEIDPDNIEVHVSLGYAYFLTGEWEKGWIHWDYRLKTWKPPEKLVNFFPQDKQWNGESLKDKSILLYCEQGIGDFIHFIRFAPQLKELGADVFIGTTESLAPLLKSFGNLVIKPVGENKYNYHCSVCSLPRLLGVYAKGCTDTIPYFHVDRLDLSEYKDNFKIGIAWTGNPAHPQNQYRSCSLNDFDNISSLPNVKVFSLQKDISVANTNVIDMSKHMTDFMGTAQIIQAMDLIITVDTSILHLAGALGKETWALIAHNPDWRWTLKGNKTVWYNSVTLFRQEEPKNWHPVFVKIESKLNERIN